MSANVEQLSTHSFSYRYFQVIKLPAKTMNPVTRYNVQRGDNSFGLFDSMKEATQYIDSLYGDKNVSITFAAAPAQRNILSTIDNLRFVLSFMKLFTDEPVNLCLCCCKCN